MKRMMGSLMVALMAVSTGMAQESGPEDAVGMVIPDTQNAMSGAKAQLEQALQAMGSGLGDPIDYGAVAGNAGNALDQLRNVGVGYDTYTKLQPVDPSGVTRDIAKREFYAREGAGYTADESKYDKVEFVVKGPVTSVVLDVPKSKHTGFLGLSHKSCKPVFVKSVKISCMVGEQESIIDKPDCNTWLNGGGEAPGQETMTINLTEGSPACYAQNAKVTVRCVGMEPGKSRLTAYCTRVKLVEMQKKRESNVAYVKWSLMQASAHAKAGKPSSAHVYYYLREAGDALVGAMRACGATADATVEETTVEETTAEE